MHSGLKSNHSHKRFCFFRRALVAASILVVARVATVGMGNSRELMHDIPAPQAMMVSPVPHDHDHDHGRLITMEVTAYCACTKCCGPNAQGLTASGKDVSYNAGKFVAADTSVLPFGTKLLIPGYHSESVEVIDRGGAIKGNKLDVYFPTHEEALKWGRQKIQVRVLE